MLEIIYTHSDGSIDEIGAIMTNMKMTVDQALDFLDIDMDSYSQQRGWDGWDPDAISVVYHP